MTFDLLAPLKFVFGKEKAPLLFDSKDVALLCMSGALLLSAIVIVILASRPLVIAVPHR